MTLRAAIVSVGDELLLGRTTNTTAAWIGARLADLGVPVAEQVTVADDDEAIRRTVGRVLETRDLVVVTGGLGPTEDDRTRAAVAELLGAPLRLDAAVLKELGERYSGWDVERMPPANRSQALVPEGGRVLLNPVGTAPGLAVDGPGAALVVLLPGPPREVRAVFGAVTREIERRFAGQLRPVHTRTLHTTGIAESVLAPEVSEILASHRDLEVAFLPDLTGVDIRLTVWDAEDPAEALAALDRAEEAIEPVVAPYRFEATVSGDLTEAVALSLLSHAWTVATAESCTGGLLGTRLTGRAGASAWYVGGIVAYADSVKMRALGVDERLLEEHGAVSEPVAQAMAAGVRAALRADCSVAITGVAGPGGGTRTKPVGTVWYAARTPEAAATGGSVFPGDREAVRTRAAQAGLALLHTLLGARE